MIQTKNTKQRTNHRNAFLSRHKNCFKACLNCDATFTSTTNFNSHLSHCQVDIIENLEDRLTQHKSDIIALTEKLNHGEKIESHAYEGKKARILSYKQKQYCKSCGESQSRANRNHNCKRGVICKICSSSIPFSMFIEHANICLDEAEMIKTQLNRESCRQASEESNEQQNNFCTSPMKPVESDLESSPSQKISSQTTNSSVPNSQTESSDQYSKLQSKKAKCYRKKKCSEKLVSGIHEYLGTIEEDEVREKSFIKTRAGSLKQKTTKNTERHSET